MRLFRLLLSKDRRRAGERRGTGGATGGASGAGDWEFASANGLRSSQNGCENLWRENSVTPGTLSLVVARDGGASV